MSKCAHCGQTTKPGHTCPQNTREQELKLGVVVMVLLMTVLLYFILVAGLKACGKLHEDFTRNPAEAVQ